MTNIVVLIKQVPDYGDRRLSDGDFTLDRLGSDSVLDEINEKSVEEALQIKEREEAAGGQSTVTVLTAGPEKAGEAIRKALSMGADRGVHLLDAGMHGSDMVQTGWALARALGTVEGTDLVITGNAASDGTGGAVPAIIAEYLGLPQLTHMRALTIEGGKISGERETDEGVFTVEASLPAVVSVHEKINEPRFPSFKGLMAAKKKEVTTRSRWPISASRLKKSVWRRPSPRCSPRPRSRRKRPARKSPTRVTAAQRSPNTLWRRRSSNSTTSINGKENING